ncbi:MAG TPA: NAD-dependent epimerase/dehydratase family protein [bacterium]|nr:NAD-dependent epimerase/dehydratase family protein [bacterium]
MKVLISGISGFLGHHIGLELLKKGYYIIGVDKRPIPSNHYQPDLFIQADVRDLGFRDLMDIDYVIHLAFVTNIPNSVRHPKETTFGNIDMTIHLMEVCREAGIKRFLFPSTASLYSHNPTPWKEDMPPLPIEPYSWQKLSLEYACKMWDLPCVIFRFFQIFGELQREDTALHAFLKAKKEHKPITLTRTLAQSAFKSGQRDFIYAGDVASAVVLAMKKGKDGEIYNIASGRTHTMEEIAKALNCQVRWIPRREYEVECHLANIDKITALGWKPETDVLEWLKSAPTQ